MTSLTTVFTPPTPTLAATFTVNSLADPGDGTCDASCTLRDAITAANANASDDTITFSVNGPISLTSALPALENNGTLTINGNGAANTVIIGNSGVRVFLIAENANVTLNGLTITNGDGFEGGGIYSEGTLTVTNSAVRNNHAAWGGGIYSAETLTVTNSTISNNSSRGPGGGIYAHFSSVTVTNSTFSGNSADGPGGGIEGSGTITNSTFSNNSAINGGGIDGDWTVINSTFSGNSASTSGGGIDGSGRIINSTISGNSAPTGGGVYGSSMTLDNTIIANSMAGGDCVRSTGSIRARNSLIEDGLTCINWTNNNNQTGDPGLNGDLTLTSGSPAVNAGDNNFVTGTATDLAGNPRIQQGIVDLGAYESTFTSVVPAGVVTIYPPTFTVEEGANANFIITRTGSTVSDLTVSLNITQEPHVNGVPGQFFTTLEDYTLSGISGQNGSVTVTIPAGQAVVSVNMAAVDDVSAEPDNWLRLEVVDGADYNLDTNSSSSTATILAADTVVTRVGFGQRWEGSLRQAIENANNSPGHDTITFTVSGQVTDANLNITDDLTIEGSGITLGNNYGVVTTSATLMRIPPGSNVTINNMTFSHGWSISSLGGSINNNGSTVTINNSTFMNNRSGTAGDSPSYGAVQNYNDGTMTVNNSVFINNIRYAAGVSPVYGSAITNRNGSSLTINNSVFTSNEANYGGAIASIDGGGNVYIANSTFSANEGQGTIYVDGGTLTLVNSTVSDGTNIGIQHVSGTVTVNNSILANNGGSDCNGSITAAYSLIENPSSCTITGNNNITLQDPDLGAFSTNHYPLNAGSPAIDAGSDALAVDADGDALETDILGNDRTQGAAVDLGSYESVVTAALPEVTLSSPTIFTTVEGSSANFTITRTGDTTSALVVTVDITPGTDMTAADYTLSGGSITGQSGVQTVTIPAGNISVNVAFAATDDIEAEATNQLVMTLLDGTGYDIGADNVSTGQIFANDTVVTNTNDSGDGSLRQAITNANAFASNDTITFTVSGKILLEQSLIMALSTGGDLTIDGAGNITLSSIYDEAIFSVGNGTPTSNHYTFTGLAITHETADGHRGMSLNNANVTVRNSTFTGNSGANSGGGIYAQSGSLTIENSTFSNNSAGDGGAIYVGGTGAALTIRNSTFSNNSAEDGGAIQVAGETNISASQFIDNSASDLGGGLYFSGSNTLTITNSLFEGNSGNEGGAIYHNSTAVINNSTFSGNSASTGGGIRTNGGSLTLNNTIIANSVSGGDCAQPGVTINAQNSLIQDGSCGIVSGTNGNLTGDPALNADFTLSSGSIAIDAGDDSLIPGGVTTDLAGNDRTQGLRVDMGAYESSLTAALPDVTISPATLNVNEGSNANFTITRTGGTSSSLAVTVNITQGTGTVTADYTLTGGGLSGSPVDSQTVTIPAGQTTVNVSMAAVNDVDAEADNTLTMALVDGAAYNLGADTSSTATIPANDFVVTNLNDSSDGSLRQAITNANAFPTDDVITFTAGANGTITLATALPDLANNGTLTITGNGAASTVISGNDTVRVLNIESATVTINGVTLRDGFVQNDIGSGIRAVNSTLTLNNSVIRENVCIVVSLPCHGGGVYASGGLLTLNNTGVIANEARDGNGGGMYLENVTAYIQTGSAIEANSAGSWGGGLYISNATVTIDDSAIHNNSAVFRSGGIHNVGTLIVRNGSVISANESSITGGIRNGGTLTVENSIIRDNTSTDTQGNAVFANTSGSTTISGTCITGNSNVAVFHSSGPAINAQGNWWGAADGPSGAGPGSGDTVNANVDYANFLADAPADCDTTVVVLPTVTISPAAFNVNEGASGNFVITRTGSTATNLPVTVNITRSTGMVDADYNFSGGLTGPLVGSQTVTIPAGQTSVNVTMAAVDDVDAEANNTLTLALVDGAEYNLGATASSTATIPQNDLVVTNTNNSGEGSLRQALTNANGFPTDDTITFAASANGTLQLEDNLPFIANNGALTITGNGPDQTILSGNNSNVYFPVEGQVTISNVTVMRGGSPILGIGAFEVSGSATNLTLNSCVFTDNHSANAYGGAIRILGGTVNISQCLFYDNTVASGGAIDNMGTLNITNSTFYDNGSSDGRGSAILSSGTLTITHSTVVGNLGGTAIYNDGGTVNIGHTILADNPAGNGGGTFNSLGYNVMNETSGITITGTTTGNLIGAAASPLGIQALADNGGPTLTMALRPESVAHNAGNPSFSPPPDTDQRGEPRVGQGRIDIGAYELSDAFDTLTVQLTLQVRPPAPNPTYAITGEVELRPTSGGAPVIDTTFTADNMGRFVLNNVPVGMYDVWVKGDKTLGRLHQNVVVAVGGVSTLTTALLLEGDGNGDGMINILDFSILSTAFGTQVGDAAYDARADFNMDGMINLTDFSLLASNFAVDGDE